MTTTLPSSTVSHFMCSIIPPDLLVNIANSDQVSQRVRDGAQSTLNRSKEVRGIRQSHVHNAAGVKAVPRRAVAPAATQSNLKRTIYDCQRRSGLPFDLDHDGDLDHVPGFPRFTGVKLFDEGYKVTEATDTSARNVYEQFKQTYDFYKEVLGRDSIDNEGLRLVGCVHYDEDTEPGFFNAFYFNEVMAYGDGDGEVFRSFTDIIDITAHELTHGVTEVTAQLEYENQAGALNESMSDVFGSMIKQWSTNPKQEARSADWLIGQGLFLLPDVRALRDMANPGTAHDDTPITGPDSQPRDMSGYVELYPATEANDNGGVHLYSGIPNRAFYLVATTLGGYSWDVAGKIWYNTMLDPEIRGVDTRTAFKTFADLTVKHAAEFGDTAVAAVNGAWTAVGVYPWNPEPRTAAGRDEL